jgi:hypothetical protein
MSYKFEPLYIKINENPRPKIGFDISVCSHNYCNDSTGLFITIRITLFKGLFIKITPIGEWVN